MEFLKNNCRYGGDFNAYTYSLQATPPFIPGRQIEAQRPDFLHINLDKESRSCHFDDIKILLTYLKGAFYDSCEF
jgi:hypothetical protein